MSNTVEKFSHLGISSFETSYLMTQSQKAFRALLTKCLSHHDLTPSEWTFLGQLYPNTISRPTDIGIKLGVTGPFVTRIGCKLVERGYVHEVVHIEDARSKEYRLSKSGRALVKRVEPLLQKCLNEQFEGVSVVTLESYFTTAKHIANI